MSKPKTKGTDVRINAPYIRALGTVVDIKRGAQYAREENVYMPDEFVYEVEYTETLPDGDTIMDRAWFPESDLVWLL